FYKTFPLPLEGEDRRVTVALLSDLLRSSYRTARLAALDLVASSRGKLAQEISLAETVKALAVQEEAELSSAALRAAMTFPSLMQDSETLSVPLRTLQNAVQKASSAQVPENLLAISLEIAFTQTALSKNPQVADLLDQFIARRDMRLLPCDAHHCSIEPAAQTRGLQRSATARKLPLRIEGRRSGQS